MRRTLGLILAILFLLIGVLTLRDYGVNSDEHVHFTRGQASLRYLLTGKKDYSDLPPEHSHKGLRYGDESGEKSEARSIYQSSMQDMDWFWEKHLPGHGGSSDLLAAISNLIFFQKLKLLGDVEAHHFFSLTVSAFLVFLVFIFAQEVYGGVAGLIAALALATYPLFLGESRFNVKDPPEAFFYTATLLSFWLGVKKKKAKYFLLSAFFFGWAMGTKFNIFFLAFTILPWLLILFWQNIHHFSFKIPKKIVWALVAGPLVAGLVFWLTNPEFWQDPVNKFSILFGYYIKIGGLKGARSAQPGFLWRNLNFYPLTTVFYTTPLVTLFFSMIGFLIALFCWWKEKDKTSLLVLFWFLVPILRVTFPPTSIYGGLRQIMEYIPAMAVLAGLGAESLRRLLVKKIHFRKTLAVSLLALSFLPITIKMIKIHPNQNVYFNPLIGGLKGAAQKNYPYYGTTMGNVYLQGVKWLNENAEENAKLAMPIGNFTNLPWNKLRKDISFYNAHASLFLHQGEYVMDTFYQGKIQKYWSWYYRHYLEPVYELKVEGTPLLKIWKNDLAHTQPWFLRTEKVKPKLTWEKEGQQAFFDFGKLVVLERFDLELGHSCQEEWAELEILTRSERVQFSVDGKNWQIEFSNSWDINKWLDGYFRDVDKKELIWREKSLPFFFAARKARFLKINFLGNCPPEIKDWQVQIASDFISIPFSLEKNQLIFSERIEQAGEYYLVGSGGKFASKIQVNGKDYFLWFDTPFVQEPIFKAQDKFLQLTVLPLSQGRFSFQVPLEPTKNLLRNPNFDEGLKHWSGGEIIIETNDNQTLSVKQEKKGMAIVYQKSIPEFEKEAVYSVTFDYKLLKGNAAIGLWQPPYPDYPQKPEELTKVSHQWQSRGFLLKPAENTTQLDFYLYAFADDEKGAEVFFDNLSVQKLPQEVLPEELWLIKKSR